MKKFVFLAMAATLLFAQTTIAESYKGTVKAKKGGEATEQILVFDYEEGKWQGAPVDQIGNLSAWNDIDLEKYDITLDNGSRLSVDNEHQPVISPKM